MNKSFGSITEGKTDVLVHKNKESTKGPGSKDKLPFYNPSMELNRDISVLVCQWLINNNKRHLSLLDGLAASGIRGIRFANELEGDFEVSINDWDEKAFDLINKNIKNLKLKNATASNLNLCALLSQEKFDYIDVDPFGSPAYYIDSAVRSIRNNGIIACTATDTSTLCGIYPEVCFRRYGAVPFYSSVMKEVGLRILLGFICREAAKYDKGIKPLISCSTDHYFRFYVMVKSNVDSANDSIKNLSVIKPNEVLATETNKKDIGPLWIGTLQNKKFLEDLRTVLFEKKFKTTAWKLLDLLEEESDAPMFFYTTENLASTLRKSCPKMKVIFESLKNKGYDTYRTHFTQTGFKTNAPLDEIKKIFE
jgi:tRNA (guanine26-N2/guanine27-N2)-dimethyltransferase